MRGSGINIDLRRRFPDEKADEMQRFFGGNGGRPRTQMEAGNSCHFRGRKGIPIDNYTVYG